MIDGAKYWPTAWEAIKAGLTAFLLPFFIIYAPVIILRPEASLTVSIAQIIAIPLAVLSLQITLSNYCFTVLRRNERLVFGIAALLFLAAVFMQNYPFLLAGIALFVVNIARQRMEKAA